MAELIISLKGREIQRYPITQRSIAIGRNQLSDLNLSNESVSRDHARLSFVNRCFFIERVNANNLVLLNGEECNRPMEMSDGDRVQLGKYTLTLSKLTGPSLSLLEDEDFGDVGSTEVLSSIDINRYAQLAEYPESAPRSLEQIRFDRVQGLEKQILWLKLALFGSALLNLYFLLKVG